jgi:putative methionine-R-sulfoxide reductase with GAF domain
VWEENKLVGKPQGKRHCEDIDVGEGIISEEVLEELIAYFPLV